MGQPPAAFFLNPLWQRVRAQSDRAGVGQGLPSCNEVILTCLHQLVDQTRFHKLVGII